MQRPTFDPNCTCDACKLARDIAPLFVQILSVVRERTNIDPCNGAPIGEHAFQEMRAYVEHVYDLADDTTLAQLFDAFILDVTREDDSRDAFNRN